jgi:hypothetical protein
LTASLPQYGEDFARTLAPADFERSRVAFQLLQSNRRMAFEAMNGGAGPGELLGGVLAEDEIRTRFPAG